MKDEELSQDELFRRDGFTQTRSQPYKGRTIRFTQFEADYVSTLECDNHALRKINEQLEQTIVSQTVVHKKLEKILFDQIEKFEKEKKEKTK